MTFNDAKLRIEGFTAGLFWYLVKHWRMALYTASIVFRFVASGYAMAKLLNADISWVAHNQILDFVLVMIAGLVGVSALVETVITINFYAKVWAKR